MAAELLLIGASYRTAGVDVRGRLADVCDRGPAGVSALRAACPIVRELFVLSTCHRLEFYIATDDANRAVDELGAVVVARAGRDAWDAARVGMASGEKAVRHLSRVACGLESVVVGEAEIAGQVRRAAMLAREAGTLGPVLEIVIAGALAASGRARSETRIGAGVLSASTAAVSLIEHCLAPLENRSVLVIGAGQAGRQALERLAKRGARQLFVASRSAHHAAEAAVKTGANAIRLDEIPNVLAGLDAVIAATIADRYVLGAEAVRARVSRRLHLVDLSVPRVLDPSLADLEGVALHTVDDLGDIVRTSLARRLQEVPKVEAIAAREAVRAYGRVEARRTGRDLGAPDSRDLERVLPIRGSSGNRSSMPGT